MSLHVYACVCARVSELDEGYCLIQLGPPDPARTTQLDQPKRTEQIQKSTRTNQLDPT